MKIYKRILGFSILLAFAAYPVINTAIDHGYIQALKILAVAAGIAFLIPFTAWLIVSK